MTMLELSRPTPAGAETGPQPRWAWTSRPCAALSHTFGLRVEPAGDFRRAFEPLIKPFQAHSGPVPAVSEWYEVVEDCAGRLPYTLRYGGERVASGRYPADLTRIFAWHVNQQAIQRSLPTQVLLHAAAAVRGGITVILPADQECGKTTTVSGLLREGFTYVTDEAVAIDPSTGWVTPFPKTLSLDPGSWPLFPEAGPMGPTWARQWHVPVERLGSRPFRGLVPPPRVVVFPRYVAGATTKLMPLTPGEAVQELARTSFEFPRYAARNLATMGRMAAHARCARLTIGSLDDAVRAIESLVSETLLEEL